MTAPTTPAGMPEMSAHWPAAEYSPATAVLVKNYGMACYEAGRTAASAAGQAPTVQAQWGRLYTTTNALVVRIGYKGNIDSRADEVESVMDALHELDGGQWMPGLMPKDGP